VNSDWQSQWISGYATTDVGMFVVQVRSHKMAGCLLWVKCYCQITPCTMEGVPESLPCIIRLSIGYISHSAG
jgi:hypothetical protein